MRALWRWLLMVVAAFVVLQLFFIGRIALMAVVDPESTAFQRSEAVRILRGDKAFHWRQQWVPYERISDHLKRAVVASEDDGFSEHTGVDWEALEKAWKKNSKAEEQAARRATAASANSKRPARAPKVVGGSTITQQLAKNLLLSGERNLLRKGQELVLTLALEALLDKRRILEIYLNSVEWGEGVFGAQAAAERYFRKNASQLGAYEAARLAVMLPGPRRFEKLPNSEYIASRSAVIVGRMGDAQLP